MTITATVSGGTTTTSIVRSDGKSQVISVSVPGPKGDSGSVIAGATLRLHDLSDTNMATLDDGSILMYSSNTSKWVSKTELEPESGNITISGGNF